MTSSLAVRTLEKALSSSKTISQNLILHSDQGSKFTFAEFVQLCRKLGISQSMSRAGCPDDNAPMERYYNTLKTKLIYQYRFEIAVELDYTVLELAYDWYNQIRPHSYNGYLRLFEKRDECIIKRWRYKIELTATGRVLEINSYKYRSIIEFDGGDEYAAEDIYQLLTSG